MPLTTDRACPRGSTRGMFKNMMFLELTSQLQLRLQEQFLPAYKSCGSKTIRGSRSPDHQKKKKLTMDYGLWII